MSFPKIRALGLLLFLAGCGEATVPETPTAVGEYELVRVNDRPVPSVAVEVGFNREEVLEGSLSVRSDRTSSLVVVKRLTIDANVTTHRIERALTWSLSSGRNLTFSEPGGAEVLFGHWSDGVVTFVGDDGHRYRFELAST